MSISPTKSLESIRLSSRELKNPRTLTGTSLLVALGVVMSLTTIIPNEFMKISLNFIVTSAMGFLFGPIPAMLGAGAIDLIGFVLRPTGPYFPGFTFNSALTGFLYGMILYRREIRIWRCLLAKFSVSLIVNVILATLWLSVLYGKAVSVLLPARLIKNATSLPLETIVMWMSLNAVYGVWRLTRRSRA